MWRLVLHPRLRANKDEIENRWTIADVAEAHRVLDITEDLEILRANRDHDLRPPDRH